jgi:multiple sugar transport system permease protein
MKKRTARDTLLYILTAFVILFLLFPLLFMACGSFMGAKEITGSLFAAEGTFAKLHLLPNSFTLAQYYSALFRTPIFWRNFWNTIRLSLPILCGVVVTAPLCGYGLAKFHFPGQRVILFFYLILMMLPYQVTLVPNFLVLGSTHLLGSRAGVILPNIFTTFGCYLMTQFAEKIPSEILENARLEGLGEWRIFWHIALPQLKSGVAALAVLNLIDTFNMVEQPLVLLQDPRKQPLSVSLAYLSSSEVSIAFVCGIIFILPLILVFLLGKEPLIKGISETVF